VLTPLVLIFIMAGGFGAVDALARSAGWSLIPTGLIFAGLLLLMLQAVQLPFSLYATFVLEQRYGFNRTAPRTFVADRIKGMALAVLLGGPVFAAVMWFFSKTGDLAWLYSWGAVTVFQLGVTYIAPVVILPLFNTFKPLEDSALKAALSSYAKAQGFALKGIYTMDGSRRSTRANAFFTGFGRWRRIVLFDTLIEKHATDELVGVLAHEVGHYKLHHVMKQLILSVLSTGVLFYLLSLFVWRGQLYAAFEVSTAPVGGQWPVYAGFLFFGFLYSPISMVLSLVQNHLSRRYEFQADVFAVITSRSKTAFITALKRLTVDNLSNLTPHPFKVFLEYSHPPILQRIEALYRVKGADEAAAPLS
jgi:STE24 endopeptidase